jgi:hypothetical protein
MSQEPPFSTTNPTWTDLGAIPGFTVRSGRLTAWDMARPLQYKLHCLAEKRIYSALNPLCHAKYRPKNIVPF